MAVQTWGINQTLVHEVMPNEVPSGTLPSTANITAASLTTLITKASARVNGVLTSGMNGSSIDSIVAGATSDAYSNVQDVILAVLRPKILHAAYGSEQAAQIERDTDAANALLFRIERNPGLLGLGITVADDFGGQVYTSTQYFDLDTSTGAQTRRRQFDSDPGPNSHQRRVKWW